VALRIFIYLTCSNFIESNIDLAKRLTMILDSKAIRRSFGAGLRRFASIVDLNRPGIAGDMFL